MAALLPRTARVWLSHRVRARRESREALACDALVLSRAKSGRTWLRVLLSRLYARHYGLGEQQLIDGDNFHRQQPAVPRLCFSHGHYLRSCFDAPGWRGAFGDRKVVFLVRNPCDVAVSEYFQSTRRARPRKRELYGVEHDAGLYAFVMEGPIGLPAIVSWLNAWAPLVHESPQVRVVRYEELRADPEAELAGIARFLGAPSSAEAVADAVAFGDFDHLQQLERRDWFGSKRLRPRDPSDPDSFKVRRGKVGGYADYFHSTERSALEALVRERLDPRYGYAGGPA